MNSQHPAYCVLLDEPIKRQIGRLAFNTRPTISLIQNQRHYVKTMNQHTPVNRDIKIRKSINLANRMQQQMKRKRYHNQVVLSRKHKAGSAFKNQSLYFTILTELKKKNMYLRQTRI
jgi:hypothetical protein